MSAAPDDLAGIIWTDERDWLAVKLMIDSKNAAIEALQRQLSEARAEGERLRAVVEAAARYIHCCSSPELSPYIKENGKYGTMSPWRELCEAVKAAALSPPAAETPKTEETGNG